MSPAGIVTGSSNSYGLTEAGEGMRYFALIGIPLDLFGSSAKKRRIFSHIPREPAVYFC